VVSFDQRWARTCVDLVHRVNSIESTRVHRSGRFSFWGGKTEFFTIFEIPGVWLSLGRWFLRDTYLLPCVPLVKILWQLVLIWWRFIWFWFSRTLVMVHRLSPQRHRSLHRTWPVRVGLGAVLFFACCCSGRAHRANLCAPVLITGYTTGCNRYVLWAASAVPRSLSSLFVRTVCCVPESLAPVLLCPRAPVHHRLWHWLRCPERFALGLLLPGSTGVGDDRFIIGLDSHSVCFSQGAPVLTSVGDRFIIGLDRCSLVCCCSTRVLLVCLPSSLSCLW
jgi:hypothetical protein